MEIKGMKEEFFDWLDVCPVQWFLTGDSEESLEYMFYKDDGKEEED